MKVSDKWLFLGAPGLNMEFRLCKAKHMAKNSRQWEKLKEGYVLAYFYDAER